MRHKKPPTVETMRKVGSPEDWQEANLDCPFYPDDNVIDEIKSKEGSHPDDLLGILGVNVKACLEGRRWKYTGKLVKYRGEPLKWEGRLIEDEVVVRSNVDQKTVWFGTVEQYEQMWCVD